MNKKVIIKILVMSIITVGVIIGINYNKIKEINDESRRIIIRTIVDDINSYCSLENMKVQMGTISETNCNNKNTIMNNILSITNIEPFAEVLDLDYDGLIKKIELKYKNQKYVYIFMDHNDIEIIVTNLDDFSYDNNKETDNTNNNVDNENTNDEVIDNQDKEETDKVDDNQDEEENDEVEDKNITSEVVDKIVSDNNIVKSLYKKYISYATYETNNYKNINVNDSSSDEYLVKHSIYKILEDNKININNYEFDDMEYTNGYKITIDQINKNIKDNFNIQRTIDFKNLKLDFVRNSDAVDNADIAYYFDSSKNEYRLISDVSIPKTGAGDIKKYSKYNKHEIIGDELFIYTEFFIIGSDMGIAFLNNNMDNINTITTTLGDIGDIDVQYVLNNHSNKVGKFKHVFKNINGNYIWVSTTQTNEVN